MSKHQRSGAHLTWQRRRLVGFGAMGVATVAMAVGLGFYTVNRTSVSGTLITVSDADAAAYGISEVYQLDDGSYRITGTQHGFKSDVTAAVTIDAEGAVQAVEILSQDETANLGGMCAEPSFTGQYTGSGPFTLNGKSYTVTDPATGEAYASADAVSEESAAPVQTWDSNDTSPEAQAMRALYAVQLTQSAKDGEPLAKLPVDDTTPEGKAKAAMYKAELSQSAKDGEAMPKLPVDDTTPEGKAKAAMYKAELSQSAKDGVAQAVPYADYTPEQKAVADLQASGLTTAQQTAAAEQVTAEFTGVDALSGATITSTAVTDIVNSAYFYTTQRLTAS